MITAFLAAAFLSSTRTPPSFQISQGKFLLDQKPFQILAGEIHLSRVPHQLWRDRIKMAKAMGLNTVSAYVFWNVLEPEPGKFSFKGDNDVARFIEICKEEGMYVILRPGPYVCAEWEFGGYPYWLLRDPKLLVRSDNPPYLAAAKDYLQQLERQVSSLQITHGGNILMVQVENEYGSYGKDKTYMAKARDMLRQVGFDVPLYVAEGGAQLANAWVPGTAVGVNGGSWPDVVATTDKYTPGGPYLVPEFYPGWLDHWGEPKSKTDGDVAGFKRLIEHGVSVSMYMFYGGTSFGFMNGANYGGHYQPDITSYDYDAPLNEYGMPTPKYFEFRKAISEVTHVEPPPVPPSPTTVTVPRFTLSASGSLLGALPKPIESAQVRTMEDLGQDYGYVLYRTQLKTSGRQRLEIEDLRDFAVVMLNGKSVATLDRRRKEHGCEIDVPAGGAQLDLLVENSGRINYGQKLPDNHQGITKDVLLGGNILTGWEIYSLPMRDPDRMRLDGKPIGPSLYRGTFTTDTIGETFLDMRGWTKGFVWVNGHNLGRYWWIGPQQTLYLPSVWLKSGVNHIVVFDIAPKSDPSIEGLSEPILDSLAPEVTMKKAGRVKLDHIPDLSADEVISGTLAQGDGAQTFRFSPRTGRYLEIETTSTWDNMDYAALSELDLLGPDGRPLDRSSWKVAYVDSEETAQEDGTAENLFDGDPDTIWHTVWSQPHTANPHKVIIDLGNETEATGVRLLPRQGDHPAKLKDFKVYFGISP
jgi:beta-galactosidase